MSIISTTDKLDELRTQWLWLVSRCRIHQIRPGSDSSTTKDLQKMGNVYKDICKKTIDELKRGFWKNKKNEQPSKDEVINLEITYEWLRRWFCIQLLESDKIANECSWVDAGNRKSPFYVLDLLYYISIFVLERLHYIGEDIRLRQSDDKTKFIEFLDVIEDPEKEALKAEFVVVTEFAHIEIGVARELIIHQLLWDFLTPQLFLYGVEQSYRDHLFHVIDVCLLGYLLLRCQIEGEDNREFVDYLSKISGLDKVKLLQNWFFAGLLHDLGRSMDVISTEQPSLAKYSKCLIKLAEVMKSNNKQEFKKLSEQLVNEVPVKITESEKWIDHGVCTWLIFRDIIQEMERPDLSDKYKHGLLACAQHNLPKEKISLLKQPISFLLRICDIIQDWGRPRIPMESMSIEFASAIRQEKPATFTMRRSTRKLVINGKFSSDSSSGILISPNNLEITLNRESAEQGISEPAIAWILICRDLKELDSGAFMDLKLTIESPVSAALQELQWETKELDALHDFLRDSPDGHLLAKWLDAVRKSDDSVPIKYEPISGAIPKERFTVILSKLHKATPLIQTLPDKLYVRFVEWKWTKLRELRANSRAGTWPT